MRILNSNPRHQAVLLREAGQSAAKIGKAVGLSAPTVLSLHKAFKAGGWVAVDQRSRGRPRSAEVQIAPAELVPLFWADNTTLWTTELLAEWLSQVEMKPINARAAQRRMGQWGWLPATKSRKGALCAATHTTPNKSLYLLWACTPRGELMWLNLSAPPTDQDYCALASQLLAKYEEGFSLSLSFAGTQYTPQFTRWLQDHPQVKLQGAPQPNTSVLKAKTMKPSIQIDT
jgi:transposase